MEYMDAVVLLDAMSKLCIIVPTVRELITPSLQVAHTFQDKLENIYLKQVPNTDDGLRKLIVCVNSSTP